MGGDITVTSEVGKGSIFFFDVEIEPVTANDLPAADRSKYIVGLAPNQPVYRILIVEDNSDNRMLLLKLLQPLGLNLREAVNGQDGVEISETWEPHLIFMDIRMPVMDGYEATRRIKAGEKGRDIRIIAISAHVFEHEAAAVMEAGCDDFVRKPFRNQDIFEKLSQHLGVRFRYSDQAIPSALEIQEPDDDLVSKRLAALPLVQLSRLHQAAVRADLRKTSAVIEEIRGQDEALADMLKLWSKSFRFEKIINLTVNYSDGQV